MRIGYCFRGYLADVKLDAHGDEVSAPDGNATYSWTIEDECERRRHQMIPLGPNLDAPAASLLGAAAFGAFSGRRRALSYERMLRRGWTKGSDRKFPQIDLLLLEWRWPIPGKNTTQDIGRTWYQNDLTRQEEVLRHYTDRGVPVVAWDLDQKMTPDDEKRWGISRIIETSVSAPMRTNCHRVEPPCRADDLLQHPIDRRIPHYHIGYVGSRYERDDVIDEWISPIAKVNNSHRIRFWGKWEPAAEVAERWPGVSFCDRIGAKDLRDAYSRVAIVPLLGKRRYLETGFVTPRPWEAVLFGSVPVGLGCHLGVEDYVGSGMVAKDPQHLMELASWLRNMSPIRREAAREEAAHKLYKCDARNFLDTLEALASI